MPTIVSYSSLQQRTAKQITLTLQFLRVEAIVAAGEVFQGSAQHRVQQHVQWSRSLTSQFLKVVVVGLVMEALKVSPRDRVQQRLVEQISLTFRFLRVVAALQVLKASSRVLLALHPRTRLVPWMRLLLGFFALFPKSKKSAGLSPRSGSELGADFI